MTAKNPHCECPVAGWCQRHQRHKTERLHEHCQGKTGNADYWKAWEQGKLGATAPADPVLDVDFKSGCKSCKAKPEKVVKELVGTNLHKLIEGVLKVSGNNTCGCAELAAQMDGWGVKGCEQRRELIIDRMVSNRDVLIHAVTGNSAARGMLSWVAGTVLGDAALRTGAGWFLDEAIRLTKEDRGTQLKALRERRRTGRNGPIPLTSEQHNAAARVARAAPPQPDPFEREPVLHLGCHLWPIAEYWHWHANRWNELADMVNGRCIVGVAIGPETVSIEEVRSRLSPRFELFAFRNDTTEGENITFRTLQKTIPSGPDDVLIYCHSKGVRPHTAASVPVRLWTEMMYESVAFNHQSIVQRMAEGYAAFGSFRTYGKYPLQVNHQWHYSGTFFAVRARHLAGRAVKHGYGGVEVWTGDHFKPEQCWNEFAENRRLRENYHLESMARTIDTQMDWEATRLGGPRCEQHLRELEWYAGQLRGDDRLLVIGSKHGGLEHQLRRRVPGLQMLSIDIAPQRGNAERVLIGSSREEWVRQQARDWQPTAVFIDGDHTLAGVTADWEFARSLPVRIIACHDIAKALKHDREGCQVDQLWAQIRGAGAAEKIVGCGWGGIGTISLG